MNFRHLIGIAIASMFHLILLSCTNTAFIAHDRAYDANVSFSADLTKVVSINAGYESSSLVAVPPKIPLHPKRLINPSDTARGDALSTLSAAKVQRVTIDKGTLADSAVAIDFVACSATGKAADAIGNSLSNNGKAATTPPTGSVAAQAEDIANDPASMKSYEYVNHPN